MAAGTADAAEFKGFACCAPDGDGVVHGTFTIAATGLETAADRTNLITLPEGVFLQKVSIWANDALDSHATPALDMNLVLVQGVNDPSEAGTETIIYEDTGTTRFQAASTTIAEKYVGLQLKEKGYNGKAYIRAKVAVAAATAAAGTVAVSVTLARNAG